MLRPNKYDPACGSAHPPPNARSHDDLASPHTVRTSGCHYLYGSGETMAYTTQQFAP